MRCTISRDPWYLRGSSAQEAPMLWIAVAFLIAMMVGVVFPKRPLKLDLKGPDNNDTER